MSLNLRTDVFQAVQICQVQQKALCVCQEVTMLTFNIFCIDYRCHCMDCLCKDVIMWILGILCDCIIKRNTDNWWKKREKKMCVWWERWHLTRRMAKEYLLKSMHCDVDVSHLIGFAAAREGELTYFHVSRFPAVFSYTLSRHYSIDCIWVTHLKQRVGGPCQSLGHSWSC